RGAQRSRRARAGEGRARRHRGARGCGRRVTPASESGRGLDVKRLCALAVVVLAFFVSTTALAQMRPPGGGQGGPTQSRPTRNKPVGPRPGGPADEDEQQGPSPSARPGGEPTVQVPQDPLAVPDAIKDKIGSDFDGTPPPPEGQTHRSFFPYFEQRRG